MTTDAVAGLNYQYYETARQETLPELSAMRPKTRGVCALPELARLERLVGAAMRYEGFFVAATDGRYEFHLASNGPSRMTLAGQRVIDTAEPYRPAEGRGAVWLYKGVQPVIIEYFVNQGKPFPDLSVVPPDMPRRKVQAADFLRKAATPPH